jgi:hypothetical protein
MSGIEMLHPGDIGFGNIGGAAGALIWAGQKIVDATSREESKFKHVFVVVSGAGTDRPYRDPARIVQAMPSGAECIEIGQEHWSPHFVYIRPRYSPHMTGMAQDVAAAAMDYVGTPYSFLDYVAIAGLHVGIRNGPVRRYVKSTGHQICSQLADQAMTDAGWHVFDDGRLPQDVTPAALYRKMMTMPGQYIVGGTNIWRPTAG